MCVYLHLGEQISLIAKAESALFFLPLLLQRLPNKFTRIPCVGRAPHTTQSMADDPNEDESWLYGNADENAEQPDTETAAETADPTTTSEVGGVAGSQTGTRSRLLGGDDVDPTDSFVVSVR